MAAELLKISSRFREEFLEQTTLAIVCENLGTNFSRHNFWTSCWYYYYERRRWTHDAAQAWLYILQSSAYVCQLCCAAAVAPSPRRCRRRTTAWFVAMLQLLERDITIDMLDYTSLSSSLPKSLHCKSRQVSTRHRRPNDDYAALHICAKIERRAFPIRAIRRPLSAIKHYHNEVNFVIHSAQCSIMYVVRSLLYVYQLRSLRIHGAIRSGGIVSKLVVIKIKNFPSLVFTQCIHTYGCNQCNREGAKPRYIYYVCGKNY